MIFILKEYTTPEGEFILIQLHTSCCKDKKLFMKLEEDRYFDTDKCEPCGEGWNELIKQAKRNKLEYERTKPSSG